MPLVLILQMEKNNTAACIHFLRWALPQLSKRWPGYKKVHRQVCKRINKRISELRLSDYTDYCHRLETDSKEWLRLDEMTRITISRFFRDKIQWQMLQQKYIPELIQEKKNGKLSVWSAGCASGEEPYSFAILWQQYFDDLPNAPQLEIIATDADDHMLQRAKDAEYTKGSLKDMPGWWQEQSFTKRGEIFQVKKQFKQMVNFQQQDIRYTMPDGPFDIIFCKNLVAMYFEKPLANQLFMAMANRLYLGGLILLGNHESIDTDAIQGLQPENKGIQIYRKR